MQITTELADRIEVRNFDVDGLKDWMWVKGDVYGCEHTIRDWTKTHKNAYLEKVKKFDTCIQAGGFCGLYPRLLSNHFKRVYTFEPCHINFHCLVNNCQKENIYKFNAVLGNEHKFVEIDRWGLDNFGMHCIKKGAKGFVPMMRIDSFNFDACDFLQLDVEGYEIDALRGSANTIAKYHPVISVERNNWEIEGFLYKFGYIKGKTVELDTIYY